MTKKRMKAGKRKSIEEVKTVERKEYRPKKRESENILSTHKKIEILKLFNRMDPDGNDYVEMAEFEEYLRSQGSILGKVRIDDLYSKVMNSHHSYSELEQSGITFQDLVSYFENHDWPRF